MPVYKSRKNKRRRANVGVLGVVVLLWWWHGVVRLVQLDADAWGDRLLVRFFFIGVIAIVFGFLFLFGHYRVTVTDEGVSRALSLFGINFLGNRAQFAAIKEIACEKYGGDPVIWIYRTKGDRFVIEFSSAEERDWVAKELNNVWQNAVATAPDEERG